MICKGVQGTINKQNTLKKKTYLTWIMIPSFKKPNLVRLGFPKILKILVANGVGASTLICSAQALDCAFWCLLSLSWH